MANLSNQNLACFIYVATEDGEDFRFYYHNTNYFYALTRKSHKSVDALNSFQRSPCIHSSKSIRTSVTEDFLSRVISNKHIFVKLFLFFLIIILQLIFSEWTYALPMEPTGEAYKPVKPTNGIRKKVEAILTSALSLALAHVLQKPLQYVVVNVCWGGVKKIVIFSYYYCDGWLEPLWSAIKITSHEHLSFFFSLGGFIKKGYIYTIGPIIGPIIGWFFGDTELAQIGFRKFFSIYVVNFASPWLENNPIKPIVPFIIYFVQSTIKNIPSGGSL